MIDPPGSMIRDRKFWTTAIAEFERSGLSQEAFATRESVSVGTLRGWIYRLRQERRSSVSLVPVRVITSTAPTARSTADAERAIEIELKTGVRLRVTTDVALDYVVALAQRLG